MWILPWNCSLSVDARIILYGISIWRKSRWIWIESRNRWLLGINFILKWKSRLHEGIYWILYESSLSLLSKLRKNLLRSLLLLWLLYSWLIILNLLRLLFLLFISSKLSLLIHNWIIISYWYRLAIKLRRLRIIVIFIWFCVHSSKKWYSSLILEVLFELSLLWD